MLPILIALLLTPTGRAHSCRGSFATNRASAALARRIADASLDLAGPPELQRAAVDEILAAYREAGAGQRGPLDRAVRARLRPVVPTLYDTLIEVDPAVRWGFAYAAAALRTPEIPPGPVPIAHTVSEEAHRVIRREFEAYLARKGPPLFARVTARRSEARGRAVTLRVEFGNEIDLELKGGRPRLPLPRGLGARPLARVIASTLKVPEIANAEVRLALEDGRLSGATEFRVDLPSGHAVQHTPIYLTYLLEDQNVGNEVIHLRGE